MKTQTLLFSAPVLFFFLFCSPATAQTLVNATGNTLQNTSMSVEYAIGEIGTATLVSNENVVTQGLLQPNFLLKACNLLHFIPNAFTPNNDNLNDYFGVKNWPATTTFELCVYNRWGQLVFKTTTISEGWNGTFKGQPQPVGTYVYTLSATTATCGAILNKGTVTLLR